MFLSAFVVAVLALIYFIAKREKTPKKEMTKHEPWTFNNKKLPSFNTHTRDLYADKGKNAEKALELALKQKLDKRLWHVLENVTLPHEEGTTQIDLVVVSVFGIFVIEVKEYAGFIISTKGKQWFQYLGKTKKSAFQNPHHQNLAHVAALKAILKGLPNHFFNDFVVFLGSAKFKEKPANTYTSIAEVLERLEGQKPVMKINSVVQIIGRIEYLRRYDLPETDEAHRKYVIEKHGI